MVGLLHGGRGSWCVLGDCQRKVCTLPWSTGDAPWDVLFVGLAATYKSWQKQPLPLGVIWVWLLTGCEVEDKGLSVG